MHDKQQIKKGFFWSALDSIGNQALGLVVSLTLANILGPSAYGLVAMLAIFIAIANVFVNSGFSAALIRKIDRNEADFATTFYFSLVVSLICYALLFISAPYIAEFYEQPELVELTRILALNIIVATFGIIPRTKLTVALDFKKQAKCNVISLVLGGGVALYLAVSGYGVWALVGQQLTSMLVNTCMLNIVSPWKPKVAFCKKSFKDLFGFGSKLMLSGLLDAIYNNLYGLIIGKQYSPAQLGLFNQANTLSTIPATTITSVIQKVNYPILSAIQNDQDRLEKAYLNTLQFAAVIIFPIMFGICIISDPLVALLLGEQWLGSAPLISILTMALILYPIHAINLNMLQVKGRSDLFLNLEVIKKVITTIMLIITVPLGIEAMCIGMVIQSYLALFVNTYYTGKLSKLTAINQLKAILPTGVITACSAFMGYHVGSVFTQAIIQIIVMLLSALSMYILSMFLIQRPLLVSLKSTIQAN
ncbi:lipopolysaccharide biosynthesis protein [Thalassotalea ponticola]|uniref:lipopolysaccharide biosynthesis protein n=1 Tax=Thalassotalea ponticola TaxID=1523392 RepID=UPI0025B39BCF|nr:lipopolysaccharide biosynthesis protein [Thalassotalea ponticola]MDN3652647.1 lipopolysaccharide biosynthesis protein [Thalassotalea ponticola]